MCHGRRLLLLLLVFAPAVQAAEMIRIDVNHHEGTYTLNSEIWFDAAVGQVFDVFRQWDNATKFSSAIVESRDMPDDEQGRAQFYIRNRGCVLFFCTSFERQGYVETELNAEIVAVIYPEKSDFHFSTERWYFIERNGGTAVTYSLEMSPKFWIPPGIGPYLIKRKLRNNGGDAINRIEVLAQAVAGE